MGLTGPTVRLVCERVEEPLWVHRGRVTAQPRLRVRGTQAKPRGGAPLWNSTSRPRHPALSGQTGEQGHRAGASMAALSEPLGGIMSVAISGGGVHPSTWRGWVCFSGNPVFSF